MSFKCIHRFYPAKVYLIFFFFKLDRDTSFSFFGTKRTLYTQLFWNDFFMFINQNLLQGSLVLFKDLLSGF